MSDNYITICTTKEVHSAKELGAKVLTYFQDKEYVETKLSDCALGQNGMGYSPAKNYLSAIISDDFDFTRLKTNGLQIKTDRQIFDAMSLTSFTEMICPKCKKDRFEGITSEKIYSENCSPEQMQRYISVFKQFEKWNKHEKSTLTCHHCDSISPLDEFKIVGNICLSNLGFTFWNWPQLKDEVIEQIRQLVGVEIKVIIGHL